MYSGFHASLAVHVSVVVLCANTLCAGLSPQEAGKDKEAAAPPSPAGKRKGTKLPVSALGESLAGGEGKGKGERIIIGSTSTGAASSSTRPYSGRGGREGGYGGRGRGRSAEGGEGGGQWSRRPESAPTSSQSGAAAPAAAAAAPAAGATASGAAAPAAAASSGAAASNAPAAEANGRAEGGRGSGRGRGGRSGGRGGQGGSHGSSSYRSAAPQVPSGMMNPFIPPSSRGNAAQANYGYAMYGSNVYYPAAAFGVESASRGAAAASKQQVMESVRKQIEYYFSVDNLCKDIFLRSKVCVCACVCVSRCVVVFASGGGAHVCKRAET